MIGDSSPHPLLTGPHEASKVSRPAQLPHALAEAHTRAFVQHSYAFVRIRTHSYLGSCLDVAGMVELNVAGVPDLSITLPKIAEFVKKARKGHVYQGEQLKETSGGAA